MNRKKVVNEIIEEGGEYDFFLSPIPPTKTYGSTKERKEVIENLGVDDPWVTWNLTVDEKKELKKNAGVDDVWTIDAYEDYAQQVIAEAIEQSEWVWDYVDTEAYVGKKIESEALYYYIDVVSYICDEIESGKLTYVILDNGNVYLVSLGEKENWR